jgi:hypothetical protein
VACLTVQCRLSAVDEAGFENIVTALGLHALLLPCTLRCGLVMCTDCCSNGAGAKHVHCAMRINAATTVKPLHRCSIIGALLSKELPTVILRDPPIRSRTYHASSGHQILPVLRMASAFDAAHFSTHLNHALNMPQSLACAGCWLHPERQLWSCCRHQQHLSFRSSSSSKGVHCLLRRATAARCADLQALRRQQDLC